MKLAWMPWVTSVSLAVSAHAAVVISEINYMPPTDGQDTEFVEVANAGAAAVDIVGWDRLHLSGGGKPGAGRGLGGRHGAHGHHG